MHNEMPEVENGVCAKGNTIAIGDEMRIEDVKVKGDEDLKAAEEFFAPANLAAIGYLGSSLGRPSPVNRGTRTRPAPTLDQLDQWR